MCIQHAIVQLWYRGTNIFNNLIITVALLFEESYNFKLQREHYSTFLKLLFILPSCQEQHNDP